jgi:ABC-2 type transport system permease protein
MIAKLLHFEYKTWLLKPATLLLLLLWGGILLFSLSNGAALVQERSLQFDSLTALQQERLGQHILLMDSFANGHKQVATYWEDPRNAYGIGNYYGTRPLLKRPLSLAPVAMGQSELHHSRHLLTTSQEHWFGALRRPEKLSNPLNTLYGSFDLAFVLVWLLPLLIVVLNYNLLSVEREQGTLRMVLAQGLGISPFLLVRSLFRFLLLFFFTAVIIWLGLFLFKSTNGLPGGTSVLVFLLLLLLYSLLWQLLCLLVNLYNKSSNFNAGLLLCCWIALVLVLPALLNVLITTLQPLPGKVVLIDELREVFTENDRQNAQILDKFYTDHPEFVIQDSSSMMPVFMYKYFIKEMNTSEALMPLIEEHQQGMEKQSRLTAMASLLVPSMAYQESLEELSGHSLQQFLAFERFADGQNRRWRNYFHPLSLANRYLSTEEFRKLPSPHFSTRFDKGKLLSLLAALGTWSLLLMVGVNRKLKQYKLM